MMWFIVASLTEQTLRVPFVLVSRVGMNNQSRDSSSFGHVAVK